MISEVAVWTEQDAFTEACLCLAYLINQGTPATLEQVIDTSGFQLMRFLIQAAMTVKQQAIVAEVFKALLRMIELCQTGKV